MNLHWNVGIYINFQQFRQIGKYPPPPIAMCIIGICLAVQLFLYRGGKLLQGTLDS